jgi:hypothetical protein
MPPRGKTWHRRRRHSFSNSFNGAAGRPEKSNQNNAGGGILSANESQQAAMTPLQWGRRRPKH